MMDKQDTNVLKAIAILCIAIHNFCHWLPMAVHENEYVYRLADSMKLLHYVQALRPHVVLNLFSHFGHYGVPVFLFLSGYGLVCKYERSGKALPSPARFLGGHMVKLWQLMLPALALFVVTQLAFRGSFEKDPEWAVRLVTFTANLFPTVNMVLGPWWFFSLILQCYVLYRLVFVPFRSPWVLWGVTAVTLAVQMALYAGEVHFTWGGETVYALEYYRYNAVGHLPAFAFGIEAARRKWHFSPLWSPAGLALTVLSAFNAWLWFFSPFFAVLAVIPWAAPLRRFESLRSRLVHIGVLSSAIFAFHPIVRHYLILSAGRAVNRREDLQLYGVICLYLLLTLLVAEIYTLILRRATRSGGSRNLNT